MKDDKTGSGLPVGDQKTIELEEDYIVLAVPTESVELEISAKVYHDGAVVSVAKTMGIKDIRDMFREARDNYIPSDAVFTLTDKGRAYLDDLKRRHMEQMEC